MSVCHLLTVKYHEDMIEMCVCVSALNKAVDLLIRSTTLTGDVNLNVNFLCETIAVMCLW